MNIGKALKNDYLFSLLNKVMSVILGVFSSALLTRFLGPDLRGQYVVYLNYINILAIVGGLGFYQSYPNAKRIGMKNAVQKYLDLFFVQYIFCCVLSGIVGFMSGEIIVAFVALIIPTQIYMQQLGMVGLVECIRYRQKLQMTFYVLDLFLVIIAWVFFSKNLFVPLLIVLIKNLFFILMYLVKMKYVPKIFKIRISASFLKYVFKISFFGMLFVLMSNLNYKADIFCLDHLVSDSQVGIYSIGIALAEYVFIIPDAFHEVIFAKTAKKNALEDIIFSIKVNVYITISIILGMLILGKYVILLLYGTEFVSAYSVTLIIFLGIPSMVLFKLIQPLYTANGKTFFCFSILFISVIVNIAMNFILVPLLGINGAAIASVLSYSVCGLLFYFKFIFEYKIKWYKPLILSKDDISRVWKSVFQKREG